MLQLCRKTSTETSLFLRVGSTTLRCPRADVPGGKGPDERSSHHSCGATRPNEAFSGRGHSGHICKECSKLGGEELAYRQGARDIDRLLDWDGLIRRKTRKQFEPYLSHPDPRIRAYASEVAAHDAREREERSKERQAMNLEEAQWEDQCSEPGESLA